MEQYLRLGYGSADLKLIAWGDDAHIGDWLPDQEFPPELLEPKGSANATALTSLLKSGPGGKVLLLTDGFWSREDEKEVQRWKQTLPLDTVRIIKIGTGANPRLKGNDVFAAEDLFAALDGWLQGAAT